MQAACLNGAPTTGTDDPRHTYPAVIAGRMVESSLATAALTLTTEADATELVAMREKLKATLAPAGKSVPSYNDLLIKLTAVALGEHPLLNAYWAEDEIIVHDAIHIATAVDTDAGLLVPVIRDVPSKSLQQIAAEASTLAEKARAGQLMADDLQGGTFTITNLGTYGIDAFTPIINLPGQCAILGVGRIISKPAAWQEQIALRKMMALSLTFDHRVVDGGPAARFLNTVREYVEQPYLWLTAIEARGICYGFCRRVNSLSSEEQHGKGVAQETGAHPLGQKSLYHLHVLCGGLLRAPHRHECAVPVTCSHPGRRVGRLTVTRPIAANVLMLLVLRPALLKRSGSTRN